MKKTFLFDKSSLRLLYGFLRITRSLSLSNIVWICTYIMCTAIVEYPLETVDRFSESLCLFSSAELLYARPKDALIPNSFEEEFRTWR